MISVEIFLAYFTNCFLEGVWTFPMILLQTQNFRNLAVLNKKQHLPRKSWKTKKFFSFWCFSDSTYCVSGRTGSLHLMRPQNKSNLPQFWHCSDFAQVLRDLPVGVSADLRTGIWIALSFSYDSFPYSSNSTFSEIRQKNPISNAPSKYSIA